jgi:hypothetical protein
MTNQWQISGRRPMNDRRREATPLGVSDDERNPAVHGSDERIGCAEIYADDFTHAIIVAKIRAPRTKEVMELRF